MSSTASPTASARPRSSRGSTRTCHGACRRGAIPSRSVDAELPYALLRPRRVQRVAVRVEAQRDSGRRRRRSGPRISKYWRARAGQPRSGTWSRWYDPAAVSVVFFTGYPGFLGSELLPRILRRRADAVAHCLVQPKFAALARERAAQYGERVRIIEGDITTRIGVADDDVVEIWHLAAVYDLSVPESIGVAVNVDGTKHVLDFAERCASLERLHYVSTCYVSGRYEGRFREDDLEVNQSFNNFYESTKYLAEVEVRKRRGLPVTIYRPSVVVGDSATGATQKFDGPYFVMQWILRQPQNFSLLPVVGRPADYRFNVVPRDFIVEAIDYLPAHPASLGRCYQLADPAPLTVDETIEAIAAATGHRVVRVPLPASAAKGAIENVPGVYRMMRIPSAAVNYFVHPTDYDTTNATRDLDGSGISVPRFADYARNLVAFVRAHPEVGAKGMA